jgi:hypothetical protein
LLHCSGISLQLLDRRHGRWPFGKGLAKGVDAVGDLLRYQKLSHMEADTIFSRCELLFHDVPVYRRARAPDYLHGVPSPVNLNQWDGLG